MTMQQTILRTSKCVAGTALGVLGMSILYHDLVATVSRFSQVVDARDVPGRVLAVILAVSKVLQSYSVDERFLQGLFQDMAASSWPLLLIMLGTGLSRGSSTQAMNPTREK